MWESRNCSYYKNTLAKVQCVFSVFNIENYTICHIININDVQNNFITIKNTMKSSAIAHSNIALIKYWGRHANYDSALNIPSNDNISMTKYGFGGNTRLQAHTTIDFSDKYKEDAIVLEQKLLKGREIERVLAVINPLRKLAGINTKFKAISKNDFPTQAGLASSAAGFAALTLAATDALGFNFSKEEISTYARLGSGSAARSIHGGFVMWHKGNSHKTSYAEQLCVSAKFDMNAVVAIIHRVKKDTTSDIGHEKAYTSPFNKIRVEESNKQIKKMKGAIWENDFSTVGKIAEENCMYMHTVMMTSRPALFYWHPNTIKLIKFIQKIRNEGLECYFTIDAGPNVHCLCKSKNVYGLQKILAEQKFIRETILVKPAKMGSFITRKHLF